jgi:uncharacterized protein involved in exopolysaccharide biosynthesis
MAQLQAKLESRTLLGEQLALGQQLRLAADKKGRDIADQEQRIIALEARLAGLRDTAAIQPPTRSMEKVGPGKRTIIALAGFLGLFVGTLAAFGAEFVGKIRAELAEMAGSEGMKDSGGV